MPAVRIAEFDTWRPGYGGAVIRAYLAGTTTLTSLFTDEALTVAADNPQILSSRTVDGLIYGKFTVPVYTGQAYYLDIDQTDQTGIVRPPLTALADQDASNAEVTPTGGTRPVDLDDLAARSVWAINYGDIGDSAATNTTTLTDAIGAAVSRGMNFVLLPDVAAIPFNQLTLPAGIQLVGTGRAGTPTTLRSQVADRVITLGGDGAGLRNLVLDGVGKVADSVAVYSKAQDETVFDSVLIKRFETGLHQMGGRRADWKGLSIDTCTNGAKLHGDLDPGHGGEGDQWRNNRWQGRVTNCTGIGVELSYEDSRVCENALVIGFEDNTGTALQLNGARGTDLSGSWFSDNTENFLIQDDDLLTVSDNTTVGVTFAQGSITGGTATFDGLCQDIVFDQVAFSNVDFTLTNVTSNIVWRDCTEDALVTLAGTATRITRQRTMFNDPPGSAVTTTNGSALKAWEITLEPGQKAWLEAKVIGVRRDGTDYGFYHISRAVHRPGSTLAYDGQTANFTVGSLIVGGSSGATARVIADTDAGATGALTLKEIIGSFLDNEVIVDSGGGRAVANGGLSAQNAVLLGSTGVLSTAVETVAGYGADFVANAGNVEVNVTGGADNTIDWVCHVQSVVN